MKHILDSVRQRLIEQDDKQNLLRLQYDLFEKAFEYYKIQAKNDKKEDYDYPVKFIKNKVTGQIIIIANKDYSERLIKLIIELDR